MERSKDPRSFSIGGRTGNFGMPSTVALDSPEEVAIPDKSPLGGGKKSLLLVKLRLS